MAHSLRLFVDLSEISGVTGVWSLMAEEVELAKRAVKSKARSKGVKTARPNERGRNIRARAQVFPVHEEDHIDGCDIEFHDREATPDAALPAARGGVEVRRRA